MSTMSQLAVALAGRYDIEREVGQGGMATVYLARDIRHERNVALKVLSPELGAVLGAERFLSEIRVTANLQHPNLLPLFDSGEANGLLFYVMPYVEGETLRARLDREKQLPIDEAIRLTTAIASALDYAHRHGVIHRDLKPENILLHEGQPLVADFGIALAVSNAGGQRVTQTGLSLGTPQYMSPEQATGDRSIDGRTDIYSLGAITYEMLAGEAPHLGNSAQAIIAKLMTEDPRPLTVLRRAVPAHVDAAVRCALEKLPADRFASGKEFADALGGRGGTPSSVRYALAAGTTASRLRRAAPWIVAGIAVASASMAWMHAGSAMLPHPVHFKLAIPAANRISDDTESPVAISHDGQTIAYIGRGSQRRVIFLRPMGALETQELPNSALANSLTFSRDDRSIAVLGEGGKLRSLGVPGGLATFLADPNGSGGMSWGVHGEFVYSNRTAIYRVDGIGHAPVLLDSIDSAHGEFYFRNPFILADGKSVLFTVRVAGTSGGSTSPLVTKVAVMSLAGGKRDVLNIAGSNVVGFVDGWLLLGYADGMIRATRFNPGTRKVSGETILVLDGIQTRPPTEGVSASLSDDGTLAYVAGGSDAFLTFLDSRGAVTGSAALAGGYQAPEWSPDGSRVVVSNGLKLWIYDVNSKVFSKLTTSTDAIRPTWTPDGKRIAYISANSDIWWIPADGSGTAERLIAMPGERLREVTFSPDGKFAVVRSDARPSRPTSRDIWMIPLSGNRTPVPIVQGPASELLPAVSPDSKWVAYQSDETGRYEIYVRPLSKEGGRVPISTGGGTEARWSPDGHRIIYRDSHSFQSVTLAPGSAGLAVVKRDSMFADPYERYDISRHDYDIAKDGRFVVVRDAGEGADIIVITNWLTEVRAKLRGR